MRFSEQRETIYKGLARILEEKRPEDLPVPVATPRLIADPPALAFTPAPNRAARRAYQDRTDRGFKPPAFEKPWQETKKP